MIRTIYNLITNFLHRNKISALLVLSLLVCGLNKSEASHATGANLTYQALGNNQYLVTFTFYRDCFGIDAPTEQTLHVESSFCNVPAMDYTMLPLPNTGQEITHPCSTATSTCNGGSEPGIQEWQYSVIVTLPSQCPDWSFSTEVSARNAAITTIVDPDLSNLYIDAFLNNTIVDNSSPTFTNVPIVFECIGQTNLFNQGAYDADGDSLVYAFIAPRGDPNTPLTYRPGYSINQPLTSNPPITLNPQTGDISISPTQPEVGAVAVQVSEYRNGVLIGTVMRDIQIYTTNCSNTLPTATGIDTTSNFSASVCTGSSFCFNVLASDNDPNDILTLSWNHSIPGATFDSIYGHNTGRFCWTPTAADARPQPYTFTVTVRDNACPSNGVQTYSYSLSISSMNVTLTSTPSVQCFGSHNGSAMATSSGNPPLVYTWTYPNGNTVMGASISHLSGGDYTLNVTDADHCIGVRNINIAEPAAIAVNVTPTNAGCGSQFGSATANVGGGTGPFMYSWNTTPVSHTATVTNLNSGNYTVNITDAHGCTGSGSTVISSNPTTNFSIHSTPATCLANDGSVRVTATGGSGNFSYVWAAPLQNLEGPDSSGVIAGNYSVVVTDNVSGCSATLSTIVGNSAGITATITNSTVATCESSEDASATVSASGGQTPYSYLWDNGDTTAVTNHLSPGQHLALVEDYNGCRAYATVNIGFAHTSPLVNLGPDSVGCNGTPVTLDAGAGATSYLWSTNETTQTISVSTNGVYNVLVTNANGCEAFDVVSVTFITCAVAPGNSHGNRSGRIFVYPNPAHEEFNVNLPQAHQTNVMITLTDILGNNVYVSKEFAQNAYSKLIDVHSIPAGIYILKVEYDGEMSTTRLVRQ